MVFSHLSTMIAIIFGLSITQLLDRTIKLIENRKNVSYYALPVIWAVFLFLLIIQWWWGFFSYVKLTEWNFFFFIYTLITPLTFYLASRIVLPQTSRDQKIDLKDYYFSINRFFFIFIAAIYFEDGFRNLIVTKEVLNFNQVMNLVGIFLISPLIITKKEKTHLTITLILSSLFLLYIALASLRLS